jgi:hypothetical protein
MSAHDLEDSVDGNRLTSMSISSLDGLCPKERIENCFFSGLGGCLEERIDGTAGSSWPVFRHDLDGQRP